MLPDEVRSALATDAARRAPEECCGVLLGRGDAVTRYVPLRNAAPERRHGFAFDDAEWLRTAREADAQALEVLGIAHSHVDTDAAPSPTDLAFGDATRWMLIVPVIAGAPGAPRAWQRHASGSWREARVRTSCAPPDQR